MALGLKKNGCSTGAALAYWLGNPILNPATMIFMGFVLGWHWVALRAVVGVVLVFGVPYLVELVLPGKEAPDGMRAAVGEGAVVVEGSIWSRWARTLWRLAIGLIPEYVVLVLLLGATRAWLFPTVTPSATGGLWALGLAVAGTLFVIPTAGEIPIVQTLMKFGLGVGPAAALLTTLPPVSLPSLAMLARVLPVRVLVVVAGAVIALGLASAAVAVGLGF